MASDRWLIDQPVHNVVDRWGIENWAVCEKRQFATGRRCLWARITGNRSPPPTVQVYLKTRQSIRDDWFNASYHGSRMEWVGVDDRFDASSMRCDDRLGLELINTIINECLRRFVQFLESFDLNENWWVQFFFNKKYLGEDESLFRISNIRFCLEISFDHVIGFVSYFRKRRKR